MTILPYSDSGSPGAKSDGKFEAEHCSLPRRWVVERFFAWIGRNRRLAKDFEASIESARAFLYAASVMLLSRRIARHA